MKSTLLNLIIFLNKLLQESVCFVFIIIILDLLN